MATKTPRRPGQIIEKLLEKCSLKTIVHGIIDRECNGNMKEWAEKYDISYNDLCKTIGVMHKLEENHGINVLFDDQIEKIKRYVNTIESLLIE